MQGGKNLGKWENWNLGYGKMKFEGGAGCPNGIKRSMTVTFNCGLETKILSVSEPSMCIYQATMKTPAACPGKMLSQKFISNELCRN